MDSHWTTSPGIHIGPLVLGIHIGPLALGIHIGPLVLGIHIGPLVLGIHIGPLALGIHIGPLVLGIHIGPLVLGIHIGPLVLVIQYRPIHIGPLVLGIHIGPLALGIHIGPLVLGIHIGPLALGIHIGPLALGIHIGPLALGIHIGPLVLGIHIGPLALGIHIGPLALGIHIGPLVLGIHIGPLALGIHIGPLALGIHIGPLALGIHIGPLAVIHSQAREEIVNSYSIAMHSSDGAISDDGDDYVMGSSAFSSAMNLQHSGKWPSDHKKSCNMMKSGIINLFPGTCPQFSLTSPPMGTYSCPGTFQCPPTNLISLTQRVGGTVQPFLSGSCGSLSAVTTNVTSTCYTSVLTIPAVQALNGNSVQCTNGFTKSDIVGNDTVKIMTSPGPVGNMTVTSTSVDQLTVTWTPPTTGGVPTSYSVTINDSSSPVVIADNGSPVYTHTFTGLVSDTLYTVSVVAINCAGSSTLAASRRTGLTSGQMYYCKAAATNTNSNNCTGPVVGGVKVFFSFMASPFPQSAHLPNPASHVPSIDASTAVGITFSITFIMAFSLGVLVTMCVSKTRSKTTLHHPNAPYDVVGINQKKIDVNISLVNNDAYATVK
ncbi:hypothetical protein EMCRGX_G012333 [Ephydatia muelleri]